MDKIRLAVLFGGNSAERTVSFKSADNILMSLDKNKYIIEQIKLPKDKADTAWVNSLIAFKPQFVLNALHGDIGEDGAVQGLLQCLNIPYAGSKVLACAMCMNKKIAKDLMEKEHIQVIPGVFIPKQSNIDIFDKRLELLEYPLVIKPNCGGSSIGIAVAQDFDDVKKYVTDIRNTYNDDAVAEKYIFGREVTCAVLQTKGNVESDDGLQVMSVLDVKNNNGIYDYTAKYLSEENAVCSTSLPKYMQQMINEIAKKAFRTLKCSGYACVDMIVRDEQVYVIEVNALPGMTNHSFITQGVKGCGMTLGEFLDKLIDFEMYK